MSVCARQRPRTDSRSLLETIFAAAYIWAVKAVSEEYANVGDVVPWCLRLFVSYMTASVVYRGAYWCDELERFAKEGGRMKTLFEAPAVIEIKQRMFVLRPESERLWGKMNAAQALAHCSAAMEMALGDTSPRRVLIGRLLGPMFKSVYSNEKPFQRKSPTHPSLIVSDQRDLAKERQRLAGLIDRFSASGAEGCTEHPHPFFGKLSSTEWATGMYKHLDHHLRQFGV